MNDITLFAEILFVINLLVFLSVPIIEKNPVKVREKFGGLIRWNGVDRQKSSFEKSKIQRIRVITSTDSQNKEAMLTLTIVFYD